MQLYIQDRSESTVATIGDFYEDMHKTLTSTGTGSYEFTVSKSEPGQEFLNVGNYVVLLDEQNTGHQFTITKVDQLHDEKTVYAEDASLQLLSKEARPWAKSKTAQPASYYFNKALEGTGWVIGVNQITNLTRTLEWTDWDTVLTRLLSIATEFDNAELDFHVELDRTNVVRKVVDIYKQVGAYRDDIQLVYGDTANDIQKTESTENFATAIEGIGSLVENTKEGEPEKHYDFSAIGYDDGDFYSPKGDPKLYSRKAHEKWDGKYGYSERHFEYETKDPQELLNRSKTELKKRCEPEVNYEISIADGRLIDINKGDTVKIFDHTYNPELLLQARAVEVDKSYTDPSQNKAIFGNFLTLISNVDPRLLEIQKQISQLPKARTPYPWVRYADDDKGTGMSMFPAGKSYMATVWNYETAVPSDNPIDYAGKWIKVKGEDGQDGSNGVPGPKGEDGQTSYFHTAWADDLSGATGFTTSGGDGKKYIGTYSDLTKADSEDPSKYNWALFKGEDGQDGQDGESSYTHIAYATSSTGVGFSQTPTATTTYVGMYVDSTATDSTDPSKYKWTLIKGEDGSDGIPGKDGKDGKTPYFHTAWANSADGTDGFYAGGGTNLLTNTGDLSANWLGAGSISTTTGYNGHPSMVFASSTQQLAHLQLGLGKLQNSTQYTASFWAKADNAGDKAHTELWGSKGGTNFVLTTNWVRYNAVVTSHSDANTNIIHSRCYFGVPTGNIGNVYIAEPKLELGTTATPWSPAPSEARPIYMGTYTDFTQADSTDHTKYTWSLTKGSTGPKGEDGVAGKDGLGIKSTAVTYQASTSGTTAPTGAWVASPTAIAGQYQWTRTVWTYTDGTTEVGYSVGHIGADGNDGANGVAGKDGVGISSTLIEYVGAVSGTSEPTGGWSTTIPAVLAGQYLWTRTTWQYTDGTSEQGFTNALMGRTGAAGRDGSDGKDGEPGSKDVPVTTVSAAQPTTAKNGDIWWVLNSTNVATAMKVYTSGAWVDKKVDQSVLNIVTLNAVEINGSTINGSEFINSGTYQSNDAVSSSYEGTTDIKDGQVKLAYTRVYNPTYPTLKSDMIETIVNPLGFGQVYKPDGKIASQSVTINSGTISLCTGDYRDMDVPPLFSSLSIGDLYKNFSDSLVYLNGWGFWNYKYNAKVSRSGQSCTLWGHIKHSGSGTATNILRVPAWATPKNDILFMAMAGDSTVATNATIALDSTGLLFVNGGVKSGNYLVFSITYVGSDI